MDKSGSGTIFHYYIGKFELNTFWILKSQSSTFLILSYFNWHRYAYYGLPIRMMLSGAAVNYFNIDILIFAPPMLLHTLVGWLVGLIKIQSPFL
jgi:hypothetical protein